MAEQDSRKTLKIAANFANSRELFKNSCNSWLIDFELRNSYDFSVKVGAICVDRVQTRS